MYMEKWKKNPWYLTRTKIIYFKYTCLYKHRIRYTNIWDFDSLTYLLIATKISMS
jgi:hypothetical protein